MDNKATSYRAFSTLGPPYAEVVQMVALIAAGRAGAQGAAPDRPGVRTKETSRDVSLLDRVPALAPFKIRSFRYQWPSDLLASWAFEMEGVILGWFVLVSTGSVLAIDAADCRVYFSVPAP